MRSLILATTFAAFMGASGVALAQYNAVPAGDAQYAQCLAQSLNNYTGGTAASPVAGKSKVEAFCQCMWNETPDDFKGNLASFAETAKGAAMNKTCERYANWGS